MSATRKHVHEEMFDAASEAVFEALHTPSAICAWWGAARAIVMPERGGIWAATWGEDEDDPEYVTVATMRIFDPPDRIVMDDYRYRARSGGLPFQADFVVEFIVETRGAASLLRVVHDGFPAGPEGDGFLRACETGWTNTFAGLRRYLEGVPEGI